MIFRVFGEGPAAVRIVDGQRLLPVGDLNLLQIIRRNSGKLDAAFRFLTGGLFRLFLLFRQEKQRRTCKDHKDY